MNVSSLIARFHLAAQPFPREKIVPSQRGAAVTALVAGATALGASLAGATSWSLLAACYVAWCYSGWALYFAGRVQSGALRVLEYVFVVSGLIAALTLAAHLYMRALGPSWIL
ncbi:MAG TPA: hypothetical protein VNO75_09415 [Gemmatimonadaceae bacterium]|nr:hypothetical protein [Gemmatimonadaceae bacterium]